MSATPEVMLLITSCDRVSESQEVAPKIPAGPSDLPWTQAEADRAMARIDVMGLKECWPCRGSRFREGYGRFFARGRDFQLHRVSLEIKLGRRLSPDERTRHTCDNPPCCNPDHLIEGTAGDNARDCVERGRNRASIKLSPEKVAEIRAEGAMLGWGGRAALGRNPLT